MFPEISEALAEFRKGLGSDMTRLNLRSNPFAGQGPDFPVATLDKFMDYVSGGAETWSGANVTSSSAMGLTAAWACIQVLSTAVARIPIHTFNTDTDGGKTKARDKPVYQRLRYRANPLMTAFRFKRLLMVWMLQHGNAIAYIDTNQRGELVALWPWHPTRVEADFRPARAGEGVEPWYGYKLQSGEKIWKPWDQILHIRNLESDGFWGMSPIEIHRQTIGTALAVREHGGRFFSNGARPSLALKHPQTLSEPAQDRLAKRISSDNAGVGNHWKILVLEEGMDLTQTGLSNVDSQLVQEQQWGVEEVCRIYNVPPHKIQHLLRSTNNNIEHQGLEWHEDSLGGHIVNWEQELSCSLLGESEQQSMTIEFAMDAIMRADATSRAEYYAKAITHRWMKPNEVRFKENLNPDPEVDEFQVSNNVMPPELAEKKLGEKEPNDGA